MCSIANTNDVAGSVDGSVEKCGAQIDKLKIKYDGWVQ
jgi:hypothetical protein